MIKKKYVDIDKFTVPVNDDRDFPLLETGTLEEVSKFGLLHEKEPGRYMLEPFDSFKDIEITVMDDLAVELNVVSTNSLGIPSRTRWGCTSAEHLIRNISAIISEHSYGEVF